MLFEKRYTYYRVKFDDEKEYWYRSPASFQVGTKVIVPISGNGKWKIGIVSGKQNFTESNVPFPLIKTKGIVQAAGWLSESKVETHNKQIESAKYQPCDISKAFVKTKRGDVEYITCQRERDLMRESFSHAKKPFIIIENYPVADFKDIPLDAQIKLKQAETRKIDNFIEEMIMLDGEL